MIRIFISAIALLAAYVFSWTAAYVFAFLSGGHALDFSLYFQYFVLAWTFKGFQSPNVILLLSVMAFIPVATFVVIWMRKKEKQRGFSV